MFNVNFERLRNTTIFLRFMLQLKYGGKTVALPFNLAILKWASGTLDVLSKTQLPEGVPFYNIYGTSCDTPFDVWWVATSPLFLISMIDFQI